MGRWVKKAMKKSGQAPGTLLYTGRSHSGPKTISLVEYNAVDLHETQNLTVEQLQQCRAKDRVSWVNVDGLHDERFIEQVGAIFGLHHLLLEDVLHVQQRPKIEEYTDCLFVTLKMLQWDDAHSRLWSEQVSMILGEGYLLSFQERAGDVFEWVRQRIREEKGRIRSAGTDFLLYALVDAIVDNYFIILEKLGDHIEALEAAMVQQPRQPHLRRLNLYKRELLAMRRAIGPLREAVSWFMKNESPLIRQEIQPYVKDLYDNVVQVKETVDMYRELLGDLFNTYLSLSSHQMNEVMKVLTIFAAIFIPLTFVVGVYGMNFDHMPELHFRFGYCVVWGIMLTVAVGMVWWFKRKRWF